MRIFPLIILFGLLTTLLGGIVLSCLTHSRTPKVRYVLHVVFASLTGYGIAGFFGQAIASAGGLPFSDAWEWPVGYASGIVMDSAGQAIVPLQPCGRIQIYDAEDRFVRGWFIGRTGGGNFKVRVVAGDNIEVFTARGRHRLLYAPQGTLLEEETISVEAYHAVPAGPIARAFPTTWYLWPFAHPLAGWAVGFVGLVGMGMLDRRAVRRRSGNAH